MQTSKSANKQMKRCPECSNYMVYDTSENGIISGYCPVCKSVVSIKQSSPKEKVIRIRKNSLIG